MKMHQNLLNPFNTMLLFVSIITSCQTVTPLDLPDSAEPKVEIENTENDLKIAKQNQVDTLSPQFFATATEELNNAKDMVKNNSDKRDILKTIGKSQAYLIKANNIATKAQEATPEVVQARKDALDADAQSFASSDLKVADELLRDVTTDIEDNNDTAAIQKKRGMLKNKYLAVELKSIKVKNLSDAQKTFNKAKQEEAEEFAPISFEKTINSIREVDAFIDSNRHDPMVAQKSKEASAEASHLLKITQEAKEIGGPNAESAALAQEKTQNELNASQDLVKKNQRDSSRIEQSMAKSNQALRSESAFNDQFEIARAKFTDNEAQVFRQGDELILRLSGISFKVGGATIDASDFSLLQKVQSVIVQFSPALVKIEGHTDTTGSASTNRKLSFERAKAVHQYLTANLASELRTIQFAAPVGYGPDRPLRPNNSDANRLLNRRVDIIIHPRDKFSH